jgi:O-acetyl-ADP-ribose deacetylase (regulator of RNase III)
MIRYVKGNLLTAFSKADVDCIAHQCNCFNRMGAGIAPQIAKAYPEVQEADNKTMPADHNKFGTAVWVETKHGPVFNLYGQWGYRPANGVPATNYKMLRASLANMAEQLEAAPLNYTIGLPKIGAGLGGGDWDMIQDIIKQELRNFNVRVYEL